MTRQECIDRISNAIDEMWDSEQIAIWNDYCNAVISTDDCIYDMCELDDLLADSTPTDLLALGRNSEIFWSDDYFCFDGYGNIRTISSPDNHADFDTVAEYCLDEDEDFGYMAIADILDDYKAEQDEEE